MPAQNNAIKQVLLCCLVLASTTSLLTAQTPQKQTQDQGDVVRVFTNLVQTDVMVFDKQGHAVNGLQREAFQLKIDGKERPIEFFERVTAGTDEEAQLAAARGGSSSSVNRKKPVPLDRGRAIFFYVDDLHMDLSGLQATKKLINKFLDDEMGQNDEAAITSASGQIGFLQQLTDNRVVLRAALEKLQFRPYNVRDFERPPMSEYQALLIENYDVDVTDFFIDETIRNNPGMTRDMASNTVHNRSRVMLQMASHTTIGTLAGLDSLARRANQLPGRKLLFFISGGFLLDDRNSDSRDRVQRITSVAARNGVVIYSMDARGLVATLNDVSIDQPFDPSGRLSRAATGELTATQDGMYALAKDTGGRAVFNTNDLRPGLTVALKETSFYYLLAWKPDPETPNPGRFRKIEVNIPGRADLVVRVRRGFFDIDPEPQVAKKKEEKPSKAAPTAAEKQLHEALAAAYPDRHLPVSLALNYLHTVDNGARLSASMEVPGEFLTFSSENGQTQAVLTVMGVFFNDRGQRGQGFSGKINVTTTQDEVAKGYRRDLSYTYPVNVEPGLYQVRVVARDEKSGLVGSANQWIEIPDLSRGKLTMSSVLLGERPESNLSPVSTNVPIPSEAVGLSVSHRFHANSYLRFLVFAYNAVRSADGNPDVAIQIQLVRDGQPVLTTPLKRITTEGVQDLNRLPYAAEIPLHDLPVGYYRLQVTLIDRVSKLSATQQARFEIY